MIDITRELRTLVTTGKVLLGADQAKRAIKAKNAKLVIKPSEEVKDDFMTIPANSSIDIKIMQGDEQSIFSINPIDVDKIIVKLWKLKKKLGFMSAKVKKVEKKVEKKIILQVKGKPYIAHFDKSFYTDDQDVPELDIGNQIVAIGDGYDFDDGKIDYDHLRHELNENKEYIVEIREA